VRDLFVFPSCGTSPTRSAPLSRLARACWRRRNPDALGPAYWGRRSIGGRRGPDPARDLGRQVSRDEHERIEERIADLLTSDGVVRLRGPDGVRPRRASATGRSSPTLGHRWWGSSPDDQERDFWMPFAPSILREREGDYVCEPKGLASPYMMLAFATNPSPRRDHRPRCTRKTPPRAPTW